MPQLVSNQKDQINEMLGTVADNDRFDSMVLNTISKEGGYVNSVYDPGGETKYGISKRSYPHLDIKNLSVGEARHIYRKDYYERPNINKIENYGLTNTVFDIGVNVGSNTSIKFLQSALNNLGYELTVDGILGPKTLEAVNKFSNQETLMREFKKKAKKYYKSLNNKRYEKGWLNRLGLEE